MRKQVYTTIAMAVILGCLAVSARAQCAGLQLSADIPFQFNVAKTTLPSGEYKLTCFESGSGLRLTNSTGKGIFVMISQLVVGKRQDHGKLVFHRYGSRHFLEQAWIGGLDTGLELPESRAERMAARELAGMKPKQVEVAVKALR